MRPIRPLLALLAALALAPIDAAAWTIETFAGSGKQGFSGDGGPATSATIDNPFGVVRGPDGAIWFCEYTGQRIRRVAPDGTISTVAGTGQKGYSGDGGPASEATFNLPHEIRFDRDGNLFVVDMANHAVRKIDRKTNVITTIAGTGKPGYSGDEGPATAAQLKQPHSIQFGPDGNLFICDIGNHVIRAVDMKSGTIRTFAGTGQAGPTPDGSPLKGTPLKGPRSLDFDAKGNLWLATREGNQVFRFDLATQTIHHIAGTGEKGDGPDGNPLQCKMARLHGIFVDKDGSVFIGDSETHRVRVLRR